MDLANLGKILQKEPPFRIKQTKEAVFKNFIEDWDEVSNLPLSSRGKLKKEIPLVINAKVLVAKDKKSIKAAVELKDDLIIESVLLRHRGGHNTVCVSSQVGCPLDCLFCATGKMGFKRNLTSDEIIIQVLFFARYLKKFNQKISSLVFMGMGEPFLNYENVIKAIKFLNNKNYFNIGARHISISTVGVIEGIKKLAREPLQINLAISLHASNNVLRSKIIPYNKKANIEKILLAVADYIKKTNRRVMIEYIMIKNFNDKPEQAKELAGLLKNTDTSLYFVNLISYNPTQEFKPSTVESIKLFRKVLEKNGIGVTERYRFGREIKAACGQLAADG